MKWFVMEEIPKCHPLMTAIPFRGFCNLEAWGVAPSLPQGAIHEVRGTSVLMFPRAPFLATGLSILEKIKTEPEWAENLNTAIRETNLALFEASEALKDLDVVALDGPAMASVYAKLVDKQVAAHTSGIPWVVVEFDHALFTHYLLNELKKCIQRNASGLSVADAFSILTTPVQDSFAQQEEQSLLAIAVQIQDARVRKLFESEDLDAIDERFRVMMPDLSCQLDAHVESFCWLPYMYEGPAWKKSYFVQILRGLLLLDADRLLQDARTRQSQKAIDQERLLDQISASPKLRRLLKIARDMVFTKAYRKDCLYHFFWRLEPLLNTAARHLGLTVRQVRRLNPEELVQALKTGKTDADELNRRWQGHVFWVKSRSASFLTETAAKTFMDSLDLEKTEVDANASKFKGECACPGFAQGIVKVIERSEEMAKMNKGDVLVAHATNPDIVPAMKKAAAIVTDLGGITCHAAIVSRELKIPCVTGTKIATKTLRDGDVVQVDATHGVVCKIAPA